MLTSKTGSSVTKKNILNRSKRIIELQLIIIEYFRLSFSMVNSFHTYLILSDFRYYIMDF